MITFSSLQVIVMFLIALWQAANPPSAIVGIPPAPGWSVEQWSLLIGAIGLQISILITAFFTGLKALQAERLARHSVKQNDDLVTVTNRIDAHVNSEKTEAQGRETALRQEIALLREMIAEQKRTADLYAQANATNTALLAQPAPVVPPRGTRSSDLEVLKKITEETAANPKP